MMIFPGVLLISGSGANDKNGTLGFVHRYGPKPLTPYLQIAQYLSERGFAVLRYDKRVTTGVIWLKCGVQKNWLAKITLNKAPRTAIRYHLRNLIELSLSPISTVPKEFE